MLEIVEFEQIINNLGEPRIWKLLKKEVKIYYIYSGILVLSIISLLILIRAIPSFWINLAIIFKLIVFFMLAFHIQKYYIEDFKETCRNILDDLNNKNRLSEFEEYLKIKFLLNSVKFTVSFENIAKEIVWFGITYLISSLCKRFISSEIEIGVWILVVGFYLCLIVQIIYTCKPTYLWKIKICYKRIQLYKKGKL